MLVTLGVVLLAASPVKVAVPNFTVVGMDPGLGEAWAESFATRLGAAGDLKIITAKDIQQVLGLERQRQLLGCGEGEGSCLAELAGALGVDAILSATFAKNGTSITGTLRVLKAADGSQVAAATARLKDAELLQDWLEAQAIELAKQVRTAFKLQAPPVAEVVAPAPKPRADGGIPVIRFVPAIVGGAAAITGVALFVVSKDYATKLKGPIAEGDITGAASTGRMLEGLGLGLMIGGGAAIAASLIWALAVPHGEVGVVFVPSATGGSFAVGGAF